MHWVLAALCVGAAIMILLTAYGLTKGILRTQDTFSYLPQVAQRSARLRDTASVIGIWTLALVLVGGCMAAINALL